MTDLSAEYKALADYRPTNKVRFVTAASLFDGHDAAINIMRRILQGMGAEVIHLGPQPLGRRGRHRGAAGRRAGHRDQLATRAAMSSTSSTWSTCCKQRGGEHIQVFGGGGGVIVPAEIAELQAYGVARIYSPEDGQRMGLAGNDRRDGDALRPRPVGACAEGRSRRSRATARRTGARWRS